MTTDVFTREDETLGGVTFAVLGGEGIVEYMLPVVREAIFPFLELDGDSNNTVQGTGKRTCRNVHGIYDDRVVVNSIPCRSQDNIPRGGILNITAQFVTRIRTRVNSKRMESLRLCRNNTIECNFASPSNFRYGLQAAFEGRIGKKHQGCTTSRFMDTSRFYEGSAEKSHQVWGNA